MSGILWFTGFLLDQILLYDINTKDHNIWLKIQNFANFKHCGSIYVEWFDFLEPTLPPNCQPRLTAKYRDLTSTKFSRRKSTRFWLIFGIFSRKSPIFPEKNWKYKLTFRYESYIMSHLRLTLIANFIFEFWQPPPWLWNIPSKSIPELVAKNIF